MPQLRRKPAPGHAALRRGRASEAHHLYLVTFATVHRRPLFTHHALACVAADALLDAPAWKRAKLLAWVLMPDHWHGLIELGDGEWLPALVRRLKSNSSRLVRQKAPALKAVWARAYHDHALRREASLVHVARYVVMNPVRAGLVRRAREWPYWGAVWVQR